MPRPYDASNIHDPSILTASWNCLPWLESGDGRKVNEAYNRNSPLIIGLDGWGTPGSDESQRTAESLALRRLLGSRSFELVGLCPPFVVDGPLAKMFYTSPHAWSRVPTPQSPEEDDFESSLEYLFKFIEERVPPEQHGNILPIGHSQGGCLSLLAASKRPELFLGAVSINGWVPEHWQANLEPPANKPVFYGNGLDDGTVADRLVNPTESWLRNGDGVVEIHRYENANHSIFPEQSLDVSRFIHRLIGNKAITSSSTTKPAETPESITVVDSFISDLRGDVADFHDAMKSVAKNYSQMNQPWTTIDKKSVNGIIFASGLFIAGDDGELYTFEPTFPSILNEEQRINLLNREAREKTDVYAKEHIKNLSRTKQERIKMESRIKPVNKWEDLPENRSMWTLFSKDIDQFYEIINIARDRYDGGAAKSPTSQPSSPK